MSTEKYEPTQEEVKKAEEMLLPSQFEMTSAREALSGELRRLGIQSVPENLEVYGVQQSGLSFEPTGFKGVISDIRIEVRRNDSSEEFVGFIDGIILDKDQAQAVWDRYHVLARLYKEMELVNEYEERMATTDLKRESLSGKLKRLGIQT